MMEEFILPEEVWVHVFHFLSTSDKLSVRSSCRFFMRLIDRPVLWKNTTLYIGKISSFTSHSWRTLINRKIASVVGLKMNGKEWKQLALRLPWIHSVTVDECCVSALNSLSEFKNLTRLVLRRCVCPSLTSLSTLRELSHLSLCEVVCAPTSDIINALSQLNNLTSLHYHACSKPIPTAAFHNLLQRLPKLKQLSLKVGSNQSPVSNDALFLPQANHMPEDPQCRVPALISLELLNYMDPILSPVALQGLPSLKFLTVQYRGWALEPELCHLKTWLSTMPFLSELNISLGYQLGVYVNSVPATVHHLSLKGVMAEVKALRDLAQRVPDLLHLHLDVCFHKRQSIIAEVPWLFPKLQSLAIRHYKVPVEEFLGLAQLSHLKHLVILDPNSGPNSALKDLTQKMHIQTNYRVNVIHLSGPKDPNACFCANY
ncbi:uncharacterized protein im:7136021 isoform X1 [Pangasianodon hypophthalmus]|uniref:uncharacterized protein im:7136021 isoform X1 n=1 Tax=Pangasianodon hypophthalmus TaxID=310915 RepID=UPI00230717CF|nr:uncharacterized protein im:7136021 isoform X1 [Pangasianodon hypophthalmus]